MTPKLPPEPENRTPGWKRIKPDLARWWTGTQWTDTYREATEDEPL